MDTNIFSKILKGEEFTKVGVNVTVNIDKETMLHLCLMLLIVAVLSILLTKLF